MPAPTRTQVTDKITELKNRPATNPVAGPEWGDFEAMLLGYLDRDGTFDISNTLASMATVVDQNTDFNTLVASAVYGCSAASAWLVAKNAPVGYHTAGSLLVIASGNRVTQMYVPHARDQFVFRNKVGASDWGPWHNSSERYLLPNFATNDTWVRLGTFAGGVDGQVCEIKVRSNQQYGGGTYTLQLAATISLRNGNGAAGPYNCGALFYNVGGGSLAARVKAVKIAPVNGNALDTNWIVYAQFDQFTGLGFYEVEKTITAGWTHDGTVLAGAPAESVISNGTDLFVVASPLQVLAKLNAPNLGTYASDSAAGSGGLLAGDVYKHSDGSLHVKL